MNISYEFTYWLRIDSEPEKEEEKILNLIKTLNGEVQEKTIPRKKQLSYSIDKENLGYFGTIFFVANPEIIINIKKELAHYKNILRFIIIKNKPTAQENKAEKQEFQEYKQEALIESGSNSHISFPIPSL